MNDYPTDGPERGLADVIACGTLFLGGPSLLAIVLIVVLVESGVSPQLIEKGMVWLAVPWFALCYALCRTAHGIKIVIVDDDGKPTRPPPSGSGA